jgi:hypothetical protein
MSYRDRTGRSCNVGEATHVKVGGQWEKISSKWGIDKDGRVAPPSQGGFGVVTESGRRVGMFQAQAYDQK